MTTSILHEFVGANIKGWPAMPPWKVRQDLQVLRQRADLTALQEFRWPRYWEALDVARDRGEGGSAPSRRVGEERSTYAGQANVWLRREWAYVQQAENLRHRGYAEVSEARWLRSTLVADREHPALLQVWAGTT